MAAARGSRAGRLRSDLGDLRGRTRAGSCGAVCGFDRPGPPRRPLCRPFGHRHREHSTPVRSTGGGNRHADGAVRCQPRAMVDDRRQVRVAGCGGGDIAGAARRVDHRWQAHRYAAGGPSRNVDRICLHRQWLGRAVHAAVQPAGGGGGVRPAGRTRTPCGGRRGRSRAYPDPRAGNPHRLRGDRPRLVLGNRPSWHADLPVATGRRHGWERGPRPDRASAERTVRPGTAKLGRRTHAELCLVRSILVQRTGNARGGFGR